MGRIDDIFGELRSQDRRAIMPFVCGGHPRPDGTGDLLLALQEGGASIAEVGIPYSDPIADGPVIASAMQRALSAGATPASIFEQVRAVRERLSIGVVAMVSVSIVARWGGPQEFAARAREAGFDGLIVPDLPLEEAEPLGGAAGEAGLSLSFLISPTTPPARAARLAQASTGFVYLMARIGVTGERRDVPEIAERIQVIREACSLPVACGFGISTAEQVAGVVRHADAAIVGSALVRRLEQASDPAGEAASFVRELCGGLSGVRAETDQAERTPTG